MVNVTTENINLAMPSDSEIEIDVTSRQYPNAIPDQRGLGNNVIPLEAISNANVETAQSRRRVTPRKGRSTRPARRTATATSNTLHDVCPPALDNQASNNVFIEIQKRHD